MAEGWLGVKSMPLEKRAQLTLQGLITGKLVLPTFKWAWPKKVQRALNIKASNQMQPNHQPSRGWVANGFVCKLGTEYESYLRWSCRDFIDPPPLEGGNFREGEKKQNDNFTTRQMVQAWNGACRGADNAAKQKAIVATSMVHYVILVFLHLRCYTGTKIMNGFKSPSFDKVMHALRV